MKLIVSLCFCLIVSYSPVSMCMWFEYTKILLCIYSCISPFLVFFIYSCQSMVSSFWFFFKDSIGLLKTNSQIFVSMRLFSFYLLFQRMLFLEIQLQVTSFFFSFFFSQSFIHIVPLPFDFTVFWLDFTCNSYSSLLNVSFFF